MTEAKRLQFIICKVLQKEAYLCVSRSKNIVDVVLMPQGLHSEPDELRRRVQERLEHTTDVQDRPYDATLLGYGLCSNGIVGLEPKMKTIVPRGHDCVTLLLGSKEKYRQYFDSHRGIYWYSDGWIENSDQPSRERYERTLGEYKQKYGDETAEYLMQMEQNWKHEYSWATYVDWDLPNSADQREFTNECAQFLQWNYDELKGEQALLQRLVDGEWDDESFLILDAGQKIVADIANSSIIKAVDCESV